MRPTERLLVLVRHGESVFNKLNLFTGWKDPDLTPKGMGEAIAAGSAMRARGFRFEVAFTSALKRAQHSLQLILEELGQVGIETRVSEALNERDYGDLSGLNKDEARVRWGDQQVHLWRRSYDVPPPGGESLKMTSARTLPFYKREIEPLVLDHKAVLVVAHGNSLRSIVMHLDHLDARQIVDVQLATGVVLLYQLDRDASVRKRVEIAAQAAPSR